MDDLASDLPRHPAWRQAIQDLLIEFQPGDVITHAWLIEHFGMPSITDGHQMTAMQFRLRQFEWLQNIESFRDELLCDHEVLLWGVRGQGYRWVLPQEQTRTAMQELQRAARKVFQAAGDRLRHLQVDVLTTNQRQEHLDAMGKLASLRQMSRRALLTRKD